ncbi:hypothetical protein DFH09DRAFT_1166594 [Mycena vulgaris]|nr:hypothetical protein DFH09DRAFT_1166594 [Mycena vulgaris]
MKFTTAFFALIPLVYALPAPERDTVVCTDAGFTGSCTVLHGSSGQCVNVPLVFNDNISAVGPDSGQDCFFFTEANCGGSQLGSIRSPGNSNLGGTSFNDAISSFHCFFG